jgi:hypothetical protein
MGQMTGIDDTSYEAEYKKEKTQENEKQRIRKRETKRSWN